MKKMKAEEQKKVKDSFSSMENGRSMGVFVPYVSITRQKNARSSIENENNIIPYDKELDDIIESFSFNEEVLK